MLRNGRVNILLAIDSAPMRTGLKLALERLQGYEVVAEAATGYDAITMAIGLVPDVVIMDWALTGIDGVEATRRVKERAPEVKVILLGIDERDGSFVRALLAGVDGYCLKKATVGALDLALRSVAMGAFWVDPGVPRSVMRLLAVSASRFSVPANFPLYQKR